MRWAVCSLFSNPDQPIFVVKGMGEGSAGSNVRAEEEEGDLFQGAFGGIGLNAEVKHKDALNGFMADLKGKPRREKKLRILLIGHQFQVPSEGQAKACALSRYTDLDLHVLAPERYREAETRWRYPQLPWEPTYGFAVASVRNAWCGAAKWYLQWYPKLARVLLQLKPDIIDLWEEPWNLLAAQTARLCSKLLPNAVLIGETEQNVSKILPPPFEWFRRYSLSRVDFLIGRNQESLRVAYSKGLKAPSKVVGNGVDIELFRRQDRLACRKALGLEGFVVGYAGRLVKEKGIEILLEAVKKLSGNAVLCFCGDGEMKGQLRAEPLVQWIGTLSREELPQFYGALDVLVLPSQTTPSWKEQFGRVIVEAQACGVPVVGSDSGAIPEVIGDAGLVFPEKDADALFNLLETLRCNFDLQANLALKGAQRAGRLYSWQAIASQMRDVYMETAHSKGLSRG